MGERERGRVGGQWMESTEEVVEELVRDNEVIDMKLMVNDETITPHLITPSMVGETHIYCCSFNFAIVAQSVTFYISFSFSQSL